MNFRDCMTGGHLAYQSIAILETYSWCLFES